MKKLISVFIVGTGITALVLLGGTAPVQAKAGWGKCDSCHTAKPPKKADVKKPCDCAGAKGDKKAPCEKACK